MPKKKPHPLSRLRYYVTLLASVVAIVSFCALLFLVPFVFDPAISTLSAGFPEQPATCRLAALRIGERLSSCNWTSCSEGCTAPLVTCVQLLVDVSHVPYEQFDRAPAAYDQSVWQLSQVPLKINIQSCGYPPRVNCTVFWRQLLEAADGPGGATDGPGNAAQPPTKLTPLERLQRRLADGPFPVPCFPSREMPDMVIFSYDYSRELTTLVLAGAVPAGAILLTVGFLCYCYCGWCRRSCPQLHIPGETDRPSMVPPELTVSMASSVAEKQ
ncbi:Protein tipE [Amphibalanus amphitrite]|uniref:Protein tipE n=1 Tax=Amphibalanus amphitrite TaxID=1232801 RepID=A0A6A4W8L5_AMPAM|nr:Protein tipE [Amphibalanus amphitrite]